MSQAILHGMVSCAMAQAECENTRDNEEVEVGDHAYEARPVAPSNNTVSSTESEFAEEIKVVSISSPHGRNSLQLTRLPPYDPDALHDIVCVGFGPANLAFAIALKDYFETPESAGMPDPKVMFLEKQSQFSWHEGMLLPGTRMQISYLKDLATMRNPCSQFTFVNYLKQHRRLEQFINLGTFTPTRIEYQDYMKWCASYFEDNVQYGCEVTDILAEEDFNGSQVKRFVILYKDKGQQVVARAKHVIVGIGGRPRIPRVFPANGHAKVLHSSAYGLKIKQVLPQKNVRYKVAVIGSGQSAAEIFDDLHTRYPNAVTHLITRGKALQQADDSPFVNEVFNADQVNQFFEHSPSRRQIELAGVRKTNYGVVQLELLQKLYEKMYHQRVAQSNENLWQHRILSTREVVSFFEASEAGEGVTLGLRNTDKENRHGTEQWEKCRYDAVILAVGYDRDGHYKLLQTMNKLKPGHGQWGERWSVARDYRVQFREGKVAKTAGIWLQGCNEATHGVSDTLLSLLAVRNGELVDAIFTELNGARAIQSSA